MSAIESVLHETRQFAPPAALEKTATISGMPAYRALVAEAEQDYEGFWARLAREGLTWHKPFTKVLDERNAPFYTWFDDGELNASYNCLDRHVEAGNGERVAVIFEADDGTVTRVTYADLLARVSRFANALKKRGIGKGDRVVIYIPMSIEGIVAMQACARIGATHSVVFGGFSAKSLNERLVDVGAVALITADEQARGGKTLPLKSIADEAIALGGCEAVKSVIVYRRTGGQIDWHAERDLWMHELVDGESDRCEPTWVGAEHPLFILYTSGSTGKPKGVQHGRLPAVGRADDEVDLRLETRRRVLVHGRHRLGHGPHVHHLRPARVRRHAGRVRGRADVSGRRPLLEDDRRSQGHRVLHRADRDPVADQGGRSRRQGPSEEL